MVTPISSMQFAAQRLLDRLARLDLAAGNSQ
jgi:hypothetical protein